MTLEDLILAARSHDASDLHLSHDQPPAMRQLGQLVYGTPLAPGEAERIILEALPAQMRQQIEAGNDADFSMQTRDGLRQRINIFRQQGHLCAAIRLLREGIPTIDQLGLPPAVRVLAGKPRGLVLVTGPTGSGKSTTLAAMIQSINASRRCHIVTIEDPIEYVYKPEGCVIHQREVGRDTKNFASALRSSLREDPDVILVGEMRDYETISAALTAAETGHLVFSTLHTIGAANTVDRIVNACPGEIQQEVRTQLASVLQGCITQELVPLADGSGRVAVQEILMGTDAARSLIREGKNYQLPSLMQTGAKEGMQTLNLNLAKLVQSGRVDFAAARERASDPEEFQGYLNM